MMLNKINQLFVTLKLNIKTKGKEIEAIIAPNETKLKIIKTIKKINTHVPAAGGCIPIITPKDVATPLPPLKLAKTGNTCPITAKIATSIWINISVSYETELFPRSSKLRIILGNKTAKKPFIISINNTIIPARLPRILNVFVAPAFLLPNSRTSIPYQDFPIQTADGIEPNK